MCKALEELGYVIMRVPPPPKLFGSPVYRNSAVLGSRGSICKSSVRFQSAPRKPSCTHPLLSQTLPVVFPDLGKEP